MTREEASRRALDGFLGSKITILQLGTGIGKSKIAIDCINLLQDHMFKSNNTRTTFNIIVPRKVLMENWEKELEKWNCTAKCTDILCYNSMAKANPYADVTILDEAHHLSEAKKEILLDILKANPNMKIIVLSATLSRELLSFYKSLGTYNHVKCTIVEAIDDDVLPEPTIFIIPLTLNQYNKTEQIIKNPRCGNPIECTYFERWQYIKRFTNRKIIINCSQKEYYNEQSNLVDYYKRKYMATRSERIKNIWLKKAGDRLKWLSNQKNDVVLKLLKKFDSYRTLTFCSSIEQTEKLGENAINSKNPKAIKNLQDFNEGKINHITSCQQLNEGMNLVDCRIGIFANLNNSEIISQQRNGRLLRHKKPVMFIPYYVGTRDEELMKKMLKDYDNSLIHKITMAQIDCMVLK